MDHRPPDDMDAWILGSGVPSLAAAVYLIEEAKVPPNRVHILETVSVAGGSTANAGDPVNGYEYRAGAISAFNGVYLESLLSLVPSKSRSGKTALDDILESEEAELSDRTSRTHFLMGKSHGISRVGTGRFSFGLRLRDRLELFMLAAKTEESLERSRIRDYFSEGFFRGDYWLTLATTFALAQRSRIPAPHRPLQTHPRTRRPHPLNGGRFNRHEAITVPIATFLESRGVDFRFHTTVTDIITDPREQCHRVSAIQWVNNNNTDRAKGKGTITLAQNDITIVSLGSIMSGLTTGTNTTPPPLELMEIEKDLDENWLLWLELCTKHPKFGNAYNFCTRMPESRVELFTGTLKSPEFFNRFIALTGGDKRGTPGVFVTLKNSSWLLSVSLPRQPLFQDQPSDVQVFWGYAMHPEKAGDFINKPMVTCSGEEIMTELLHHLQFPSEPILPDSITIPSVLPRMTAMLLPRAASDRPQVIPEGMTNLALIGQFVEIPGEVVMTMDYGVEGARIAVQRLMGLQEASGSEKLGG